VTRERGFGTAAWMIGMAMVILPMALIALSLPRWFDRAELGRTLAQDIARTVARSVDLEAGSAAAAVLVAEILRTTDVSSGPGCAVSCVSYRVEGDLGRGRSITATVTVELPGIVVPLAGTVGNVSWSASHSERVDDFRSFP